MSTTRARQAALALIGVVAVTCGIALLPAGHGTPPALAVQTSQHPSASPSPSTSGSPSPGPTKKKPPKHAGTTVYGKKLYNGTSGPLRARSSVTVNQTTNLTNQFVTVRWKNFTPSGPAGTPLVYNDAGTTYPVMVAECDTIHVKYWKQCYGSNVGGLPGLGPAGPMNTAYATTDANGTGEVNIQILVDQENQFLACGFYHRCSLVIVPAQGGNGFFGTPLQCNDHSQDQFGDAFGQSDFDPIGAPYAACSWRDRIVVPLSFVRAPKLCQIRHPDFTAAGSPMLNLAMQQWIGKLCSGAHPITMVYSAALTEPEAIQDLGNGLDDIAFTTRPGPTKIGTRTYTFAPLSVSAVSVAYWVDNPTTYQPVTNLKLDPRLVAKLVTQSYDFASDGCQKGVPPPPVIGCDSAVDGNPLDLFADPEFKKLNPKVLAPLNAEFQVPTVMSGHSDMTWEVTSWITANPDADGFMKGGFDPWGMHVNTDYLGLHYPVDSFTGQDNYPVISHKYSPAFPLSSVVQIQAENTDDGTDWEIDPTTGNYPKDPVEFPGARSLFAIVDQGDAATLQFPVAKLLNDKGKYVAPTLKSMRIALSTMVPSGSNGITRQVDFTKQRPGAYPLTMIIYAMVPISGISKTKAAAIASFLDYVAGPGQHRGLNVGELPPGYLPLTTKMRAQTLKAATEVLDQSAAPKKSPSASPSPSSSNGSGSNSGSGSGSPSSSPSSSPSASPTPSSGPHIVTLALKSASTTGLVRYALPVLLIIGGLAALGGASSLIASTAGSAIVATARRLRRPRVQWRRK